MSEHDKLLMEIERFIKKFGMSESQFGARACNQRSLLWRMRRGEGVTLDTAGRVRAFIREQRAKKKADPVRGVSA